MHESSPLQLAFQSHEDTASNNPAHDRSGQEPGRHLVLRRGRLDFSHCLHRATRAANPRRRIPQTRPAGTIRHRRNDLLPRNRNHRALNSSQGTHLLPDAKLPIVCASGPFEPALGAGIPAIAYRGSRFSGRREEVVDGGEGEWC